MSFCEKHGQVHGDWSPCAHCVRDDQAVNAGIDMVPEAENDTAVDPDEHES